MDVWGDIALLVLALLIGAMAYAKRRLIGGTASFLTVAASIALLVSAGLGACHKVVAGLAAGPGAPFKWILLEAPLSVAAAATPIFPVLLLAMAVFAREIEPVGQVTGRR
ncbi:hypothetical protein [Catellatospora sp. TT07R-123]|uniref:hypothetical protein n=1 Tax=Catellatospora sp. TT07R-123 TaxID=2733863 RepID=UPI001BB400BA|nr:hypothetical protein [Catellatospora sp. TT07R-123]